MGSDKMTLRRAISTYAAIKADCIPTCSPAHIQYLVQDMQNDIAVLWAALSSAQADADARVKAAVEAERERCAKIADAVEKDAEDRYQSHRAISDKFEFGREDAASDIAAAIRSGKSGAKQ